MSTAALPPPPRTLTFAQVATKTPFGMSVSWQELLQLLQHPDAMVVLNFEIIRGGESSKGGVEVPREIMVKRALDGMRWAAENGEQQTVNVNATSTGTLWIG